MTSCRSLVVTVQFAGHRAFGVVVHFIALRLATWQMVDTGNAGTTIWTGLDPRININTRKDYPQRLQCLDTRRQDGGFHCIEMVGL